MTKLDDFAGLILAGEIEDGIQTLREFRQEIVTEHRRRVANEDDYYACFLSSLVTNASKGSEKALNAIQALIEEKSFLNETDGNGFSLVALLAHDGLVDSLKIAVDAGADPNVGRYPALSAAVFPSELPDTWLEICEFLILKGANLNGTGLGNPPLLQAISRNYIPAVEFLVENGADLNLAHDLHGDGKQLCTALHYAVMQVVRGDVKASTIKRLVELGADPMVPNHAWQGAYHFLKSEIERRGQAEAGEIKETLSFLSSREEWKEMPPFICPTCAEKVKYDAKACRFCGQILNRAVKLGYPEFYVEALNDLDLWRLKYDYIKHANPDFNGSITAPSILGNLFSYGKLDEYNDYQVVIDAMRARESALAGGDSNSTSGYPDRTPNYWKEAKPEQRALYLVRKYLEIAQQYTKTFSGRDLRQDPENLDWAIGELRELVDLAEQTDLSKEEYADHFRGEIVRCTEQKGELQQRGTLSERNRSLASDASSAVGRLEYSSSSGNTTGPAKKPNVVLWMVVIIVALVVLGAIAR